MLDSVLAGVIWLAIFIPSAFLISILGQIIAGWPDSDIDAVQPLFDIWGGITGILIFWLYQAMLVSSSRQATVGKIAVGIVVTDEQGRRISFARATGRWFGQYLSGVLLIGYLIQPFTAKRQTLHDIIAGCLVLRKVPR